MNEKDYCKKLYDKSVKSGQSNDDLWLKYKQLRNNTLKSIRKVKSESIANILEDQQNHEIKKWKVLKTLIPTKSSKKSIPNDFSSVEINALNFNQHFINTPIELTKNIEPSEESLKVDLLTDKTFSLPCVSTEEVIDIMMKMDSKKAVGPDGLLVRFLQLIINEISPVLCDIINKSLTIGKVPNMCKLAKMTPLHKSANLNDLNNYRPISVVIY
jgi:hypothetical protein